MHSLPLRSCLIGLLPSFTARQIFQGYSLPNQNFCYDLLFSLFFLFLFFKSTLLLHFNQIKFVAWKYLFLIRANIGLMSSLLANGPGDRGSIPDRVIPKTKKMLLEAALLNSQHYKGRVKWSNPENGVAPSPTPMCDSYWKGNLRVTFDKGRQLYFATCAFSRF